MTAPTPSHRQALLREVSAALRTGASGAGLVDLIIRTGWQPGLAAEHDADHLIGKVASGKRVPITIHRAQSAAVRVR